MIKPTIGRVVLYHPRASDRIQKLLANSDQIAAPGQEVALAATVVHVYNDNYVNLIVFDSHGNPHPSKEVLFIHDEETQKHEYGGWCEWPPLRPVDYKSMGIDPVDYASLTKVPPVEK